MKDNRINLKFLKGITFVEKTQVYLCPLVYFLTIVREIITKEKKSQISKLFEEITLPDTIFICENIISKNLPLKNKIKNFLNYFNSFGFGKIYLKYILNNKIIFYQKKAYLSESYKFLFKEDLSFYLEEINLFYLKNFLSLILKKEINAKIKIKNNFIFYEFIITNNIKLNYKSKNYQYIEIKKKFNISNLLKKLILDKHLKLKEGKFLFGNIYAILLPYFFIFSLLSKLDLKKYEIFFNELGIVQGKASVDMHKKIYGVKEDKILKQILSLSEMSGFGIIIPHSLKKNIFEIQDNFDESFNKYFNLETIDFFRKHIRYIGIGACENCFNKKINFIVKNNITYLNLTDSKRILNKNETKLYDFLNKKNLLKKF